MRDIVTDQREQSAAGSFLGRGTERLRGEQARQQVSRNTAHRVHREDIEGVVHSHHILQLRGEIATDGAHHTKDHRRPDGHETGGGSDGDQSCNRARAETDGGPFLVNSIVQEDPGESSHRRGQVGDDAGRDRAQVGAERGAPVEAKPTHPEENGTNHHVGDIVGAIWQAMDITVAAPLAEHHGVGQSGGAGRDMDRGSAREVQTPQLVHPAGRVPCPAGNRIINDGGPHQHKHHTRQHATSIGGGTNGQGRSASHRIQHFEILSFPVCPGGTHVMAANMHW